MPAVGGSSQALRLVVEFGAAGERALAKAGPDAADVVFGDYADPVLRNQAVAALGEHGAMALVILDKYATDQDFREILRTYGAAIIPPIAQADTSPEALALLQSKERRSFGESLAKIALLASSDNGQAVIRTIKEDGVGPCGPLSSGEIRFYQFLPLYDLLHLGNVLSQGHSPTSGEMTWAVVDGCFVIADVLSLAAVQPEGAAAVEAVRSEVKAAAREGAKSVGRELVETGGESSGRALAGSVAERGAAIEGAQAASRWARPLVDRAIRGGDLPGPRAAPRGPSQDEPGPGCDRWRGRWPPRLACGSAPGSRSGSCENGATVAFRIPPERGLKYVAAQMVQASVGVVGFQKMEEHMASRRPRRP